MINVLSNSLFCIVFKNMQMRRRRRKRTSIIDFYVRLSHCCYYSYY